MGIAGFIMWGLFIGVVIGTVMFVGYVIEYFDLDHKLSKANGSLKKLDTALYAKEQAIKVRKEVAETEPKPSELTRIFKEHQAAQALKRDGF
jgi:NAD/NADP transhydrogenase beta subunit